MEGHEPSKELVDQRPPSRWRFSLRSLLIALTLLSVGFGWLAVHVRRHARQLEVFQQLHMAGCAVEFVAGGWPWLVRVVGRDRMALFERIETVEIPTRYSYEEPENEPPAVTNADLAGLVPLLEELPYLRTLYLTSDAITNEGLQPLRRLKQLDVLELRTPQVTSAGIKPLEQALPNLRVNDD